MTTKSNQPRVTLAQSKTPMPLKNKAVKQKRATPTSDAYTKRLLLRVVKFCEDHGITAYELSRDSEVPKATCERVLCGGVYYLKSKTIDKLTHWLEVSMEPQAPQFYSPPVSQKVASAETKIAINEIINSGHQIGGPEQGDMFPSTDPTDDMVLMTVDEVCALKRKVSTLEAQVSDLARAMISLQVKVGL